MITSLEPVVCRLNLRKTAAGRGDKAMSSGILELVA